MGLWLGEESICSLKNTNHLYQKQIQIQKTLSLLGKSSFELLNSCPRTLHYNTFFLFFVVCRQEHTIRMIYNYYIGISIEVFFINFTKNGNYYYHLIYMIFKSLVVCCVHVLDKLWRSEWKNHNKIGKRIYYRNSIEERKRKFFWFV